MSKSLFVSLQLIALGTATVFVLRAQQPVAIHVDAGTKLGPYTPIYAYFGYDEPNYTYTKNGTKLIGELAKLSTEKGTPSSYIRTHFMLATGDGTPGLKWGSTNAYTEDAAGKPIYDWTLTDRIFDTYLRAGAKPFVEIGFMPKALSTKPDPYQPPPWIPGGKNEQYSIGWSYPPNDFAKWGELVYQWTKHAVEKYGQTEVATWYWEVWNEPDISYWHGTAAEYNALYDYAVAGVKRALPTARVGGPATTGPSGEKAGKYLQQFLEHCATGENAATRKTGSPLDFITYHAKGRPGVADGHVRMGISKNAEDVSRGMEIIAAFPQFQRLPIILSESDPEGCAACSARVYPQNAYRNGTLYPAYTAVMMKAIFELNDSHKTNIAGMLSWAFEFENQPYFEGFRTLATNGIDKPVLNIFRMAAKMSGDRILVESSGKVSLDAIVKNGVRDSADVDALATRSGNQISVMAWNYHDDDVTGPESNVVLTIAGIPYEAKSVRVKHYRIDGSHSNAYAVWKSMGSPQAPTAAQYATLERAGQLSELSSPNSVKPAAGMLKLELSIPRQGISLLQFTW